MGGGGGGVWWRLGPPTKIEKRNYDKIREIRENSSLCKEQAKAVGSITKLLVGVHRVIFSYIPVPPPLPCTVCCFSAKK